jgi:hypothetical protein
MRIATRARERPRADEGRNNPLSAPMRIMLDILATACGTLCATVAAAAPGAPARLVLPVDGTTFYVNTMAFSASGDKLCLAGTDPDDMATTTVHFLLIDRVRNAVAWRTKLAVPNDLANIHPVKCLVAADRVYVLANADTSLSPPIAETQTHVIAFDLHGKRIASARVDVPGMSQYGYAMAESPDGLRIAGYTRDRGGPAERYGTYSVTLGATLRPTGAPVIRKNGAYAYPLDARIVGDSLYVAGRFYRAEARDDDFGTYAASRLRTGGGYVWSTPTALVWNMDNEIAVGADGTSYSLGSDRKTTTLAVVPPDGKARAPLTYRSAFCATDAIAPYGDGIVAVRQPCTGKEGYALVSIAAATGKEERLTAIPGEPLHVATHGPIWAVLARENGSTLVLHAGTGDLRQAAYH